MIEGRALAMKEDKENTRPKERKLEIKYDDAEKTEKTKEKKEAMTKVLTLLAALATPDKILFFKTCV